MCDAGYLSLQLKLDCELTSGDGGSCPDDKLDLTEMVEIALDPRGSIDVLLTVTPLCQGHMTIKGLRYEDVCNKQLS